MAEDKQILTLILDELIPPSDDGRLPGAGALGVAAEVEAAVLATPSLAPVIEGGLSALDALSRARNAGGFGALSQAERVAVLHELEGADPVFVPTVAALNETLGHLVHGGDIVVTMGAGDIGGAAGRLRDSLCGQAGQPDLDLRTDGR